MEQLTFSPEKIIGIVEEIGNLGDVIILKKDGLRSTNKYSIVIIVSNEGQSFRCDGNSFEECLQKILVDYQSYKQGLNLI